MSKTATEKSNRAPEVEEQTVLEENLGIAGKNMASDKDVASRARAVVVNCLLDQEELHVSRRGSWADMEKVYNLQSLNPNADAYGVHMATVFSGIEEYAGKMNSAIFGTGREIIDGTPEDREYGRQASAAVAMVREQFRNELRLPQSGMEIFREAGIKGAIISKLVPSTKVHTIFTRDVSSRTPEGEKETQYIFGDPQEIEVADTTYESKPVLAEDFRIPSTANGVKDAAWCGDFSYWNSTEIDDAVARGHFSKEAAKRLYEDKAEAEGTVQKSPTNSRGTKVALGDKPDDGPHISQYAVFEWWGLFDIKGNGRPIPCVVTLAMPKMADTPQYATNDGEVLRVTRNPYFHQRAPYIAYRPLSRLNEFWTKSPAECLANSSYFEDEMALYGLMSAALESSPPLEVGDDANVLDSELDGWLPGKRIRVEQSGNMGYLVPPNRSGIPMQVAEYWANKSAEIMGLGKPSNAPRVAAAGVMTDAQQIDMRTAAWISGFETQYISEGAELLHAYNRQFVTKERKINVLGVDGLNAEDVRTVKPEDLVVEVRFEPIVGRALLQDATQVQGLVNSLDRMMMMNLQNLQQGRPPYFDTQKVMWMILSMGYGIKDKNVLTQFVDPLDMPTPSEEHHLFRRGERPQVMKGENFMLHALEHMAYAETDDFAEWEEEDRVAFVDHIRETLDMMGRMAQAAMPQLDEMAKALLGTTGVEGTRPGVPASGGAGPAQAGQSPGSPAFRGPSQGQGFAPNNGAI